MATFGPTTLSIVPNYVLFDVRKVEMLMTRLKYFPSFCIIIALMMLQSSAKPIHSQAAGNWIYTLSSTANSYDILRVNMLDDTTERVFSLARVSVGSVASALPEVEVDAVKTFLASIGLSSQDVDMALNERLDASIQSISVAPNNQEVALNVHYQKCFHPQSQVCFGSSEVRLVPSNKVIWRLGFHENQYAPKSCIVPKTITSSYLNIQDLRWTQDAEAIVVALGGDAYCFGANTNSPLVVVPTSYGGQAFSIGEARTWAILEDSHTIDAVMRNCQPECQDSVNIINFEPESRQTSQSSYSLGKFSIVNAEAGMAVIDGIALLDAYDSTKPEGEGGLILFNPKQEPHVGVSQRVVGGDKKIAASADNKSALIESISDGSLWEVRVVGNKLQMRQIVKQAVESWNWGPNKMLLVKFKGETTFSILNDQGITAQKVDIAAKIKSAKANAVLSQLDW
jgi:hypothetical protein